MISHLIVGIVCAAGFHILTYKFPWVKVKLDHLLDRFFKKST